MNPALKGLTPGNSTRTRLPDEVTPLVAAAAVYVAAVASNVNTDVLIEDSKSCDDVVVDVKSPNPVSAVINAALAFALTTIIIAANTAEPLGFIVRRMLNLRVHLTLIEASFEPETRRQ